MKLFIFTLLGFFVVLLGRACVCDPPEQLGWTPNKVYSKGTSIPKEDYEEAGIRGLGAIPAPVPADVNLVKMSPLSSAGTFYLGHCKKRCPGRWSEDEAEVQRRWPGPPCYCAGTWWEGPRTKEQLPWFYDGAILQVVD